MKRVLPILATIISFTSCESSKKQSVEIKSEKLTTDQSVISYTDIGQGDYTLLFVHGWNIDKSYWTSQQEYFRESYRIITMDLPGFGESESTNGEYSIESYGVDIKSLINTLRLKNVILIGHSMGGRIILEAAQQNDQVIALIGVDNFKEVSQQLTDELQTEVDGFVDWLKSDFANNSAMYVDQYLIHVEADSVVRDRIVDDYRQANPESAILSISAYLNYAYQEEERLAQLSVPLYLISSNMSPVDTIGLGKTGLDYHVYEIDNTGHFPMVEQSEVFNSRMAEALDQLSIGLE